MLRNESFVGGPRTAWLRSFAGRCLDFLWRERLWWMIPTAALLLLLLALLMWSARSMPRAPYIYTTF